MNMLGQLSAVIEHHAITPMAFAGTSAGAVVASLSWAGYSPKEIRDLFVGLSVGEGQEAGRETIVDLLGPFESGGDRFDYDRFKSLAGSIKWAGRHVVDQIETGANHVAGAAPPGRRRVAGWLVAGVAMLAIGIVVDSAAWAWGWVGFGGWILALLTVLVAFQSYLCVHLVRILREIFGSARGFVRALQGFVGVFREVRSAGLAPLGASAASIYENFLGECQGKSPGFASSTVEAAGRVLRAYREIHALGYERRGFFAGDRFEAFLDESLKASPRFAPYRQELGEASLTFGRVKELWRAHQGNGGLDAIVPLILTATNLTTRELVLITSYEDRFDDLSIARAVRASAGFPIFFRPVELRCPGAEGWYVDGGVIANFPSWVFSRELRRRMAGIERYRDLASRPWLNIGLRVVADRPVVASPTEKPSDFFASIGELARGQVRNELEKALVADLPRTIPIEQPVSRTNAPPNLLDVDQLTDDKIRAMFARGEEFATDVLSKYSFALPRGPEKRAIEEALEGLVRRVLPLFGQVDNGLLQIRANLFLPESQELVLRYGFNMNSDVDRTFKLAYNAGLTGFCFTRHRPYLCNLRPLRDWAQQTPDRLARLLGMTPDEHLGVRADRTWLASVPIFDPMDCWFVDVESPRRTPKAGDLPVWSELSATLDGALFGVLNLDAAMPYVDVGLAEDTERALTDPRTLATFKLMEACSFDLGRVFSQAFAKSRFA